MFKVKINSQNFTDTLSKGLKLPQQTRIKHMFQIHYTSTYIYVWMCVFVDVCVPNIAVTWMTKSSVRHVWNVKFAYAFVALAEIIAHAIGLVQGCIKE